MHFWPESSTLSEDGASAAPAASAGSKSSSSSAGPKGASGSIFSQGAGMPAINAGEIMLSRAETAALAALETEPDENHGLRRAKTESGLNDAQIKMLQRRAKHALSRGITLKGVGFVRKPTPSPAEEPSLLRKAATQEAEAIKEALREQAQRSYYTLPDYSDHRVPTPHSQGEPDDLDSVHALTVQPPKKAKPGHVEEAEEANAQSTLAAVTAAHRRMIRRRRS